MGKPASQGVVYLGAPPAGDQVSGYASGVFTNVGPGDPFAFRGPMDLVVWASLTDALTTTNGSLAASVAVGSAQIAPGVAVNSVNVPPGTTWATFAGSAGTLALPAIWLPGFVTPSASQITGLPITAELVGAIVSGPGIPLGTTVLAITTAAIPATNNSPLVPGTVAISDAPTQSTPFNNQPQFFRFALGPADIATGVDPNAMFTGASVVWSGTVQLETSWDGGNTWIVGNIGTGALAQFNAGTPINVRFGEPERFVLYRLNCTQYASGVINWRISQTGGANESLAIGPLISG